jgi:hypothetical protein
MAQTGDGAVDEAAVVLSPRSSGSKISRSQGKVARCGWDGARRFSRGGGYSGTRSRRCWSVARCVGQASSNGSGKEQQAADTCVLSRGRRRKE